MRSGKIAIVGRPNVGKSTLLNALVGQKVSIVTPKPETTRCQILGIKTYPEAQFVYVDTPGIPKFPKKNPLHRSMTKAALSAIWDVDLILWVLDRYHWFREDGRWCEVLKNVQAPVIAVINKIDQLRDKAVLLPTLRELSKRMSFLDLVPISAKKGLQVKKLESIIQEHLPVAPPLFPPEIISDKSRPFFVMEIIREALICALGEELPYQTVVQVDIWKEEPKIDHIAATIWVEKMGQKKIVIGEGAKRLKRIGSRARLELERLLKKKVFLQLWVKIKAKWHADEKFLRELGFSGPGKS